MSKRGDGIHRHKGSPVWQIDVQFGGARLRRSSGTKDRSEAKAIVEAWRVEQRKRLSGAAPERNEMTISVAAERYYEEQGCRAKSAAGIDRDLEWLVHALGPGALLSSITENTVLQLAAKRRGLGARNRKTWAPCTEATINREVVDLLRRILLRATITWKVHAASIDWKAVRAVEAKEGRAGCEVTADAEKRLLAHLRPDMHDIVRFATLYGVRIGILSRLQWRQVDFEAGLIRVPRKTRKPGVHWQDVPLTATGRAILLAQVGRHRTHVWTYVVHRARGRRRTGERLPLTWAVLRKQFDNARARAGLDDVRRHDLRHTAARRMLRSSKNIRAVQRLLGHSDISTTAIYADALIDDVREALEGVESRNSPVTAPADFPESVGAQGRKRV